MKRLVQSLYALMFVGVAFSLVLPSGAAPQTRVAVVTTPSAKVDAAKLRAAGMNDALAGRFTEGLKALRAAAEAVPNDAIAAEAVRLLEKHLVLSDRAARQRAVEYARAVARVEHSMLAQAYAEKATEAELKLLRDAVRKIVDAYDESGTADELEEAADAAQAAKLRSESLKALGQSAAAVQKAVKLLKDRKDTYAGTFRSIADRAATRLQGYREAWAAVSPDEHESRRRSAQRLKEIEYDVTDALADLDAMTIEKAWRVALVQARLARRLAEDKDKLVKETWFRGLVADMEARGKKMVKAAEWYDALSVYASLKELLPDDEGYQEMVKDVERHVRVLGIYGRKRPATQSTASSEPTWRELVANVDADMVEKVIGQLDLSYVSSVDYRKVTRGALRSIKILAETPQAARSFAGLKDDAKRQAFIQALDRLLADVKKRDRLDHLDLILALNSVLRASEDTVNIPTEVLAVEFTDGFLHKLDKFSSMVWPHDVPEFEKQTMGHFHGVGIQIAKEPGEPLRVVTPLLGTPAFRAGVKAGDLIVKVDGRETRDLAIDKLVQIIMGKAGTKVALTVKRRGRTRDIEIVRDEIHVRTVKGWQRRPGTGEWDHIVDLDGAIGYLRVTQFTAQTAEHVAEVLRELRKRGARAVVLDLRFNPGGLLRAAAQVANEFLLGGRIVSTRGRRVRHTEHNASPAGGYLDGDLVVLVNQYSASAAEIVSGALKDWKRAMIVGQRTYGKGSVQNVIDIRKHRARLKLTTAYYYLPHGRLLHRKNGAKLWGVDPDVEVVITPRQTKRWLDIRRKTDIVHDVQLQELQGDLARQYEADIQLSTAVLLLRLMRLQHRASAA